MELSGLDYHKFNILDATRRKIHAECKDICKDRMKATYIVKSVSNHHKCTKNILRNKQFKLTWVGSCYILKFKEKPHWPACPAKEIMNMAKEESEQWWR